MKSFSEVAKQQLKGPNSSQYAQQASISQRASSRFMMMQRQTSSDGFFILLVLIYQRTTVTTTQLNMDLSRCGTKLTLDSRVNLIEFSHASNTTKNIWLHVEQYSNLWTH